ncbi:heat shock 70 kDa protein 4 [Trichuris trichiura]|uniref:Heat shock 70 kDa protein 4 n=1 Tax=Trichuris trichiura TaxID=36087 RepID=A0A077ZGB5_TRITR|nr:heat shock 70 kDa protein 4 [Trichuris trichiura]
MSVVGFDFGNQSCYVGVARQGGIEVVTNDYSVRATPTCVSYGSNLRSIGTSAWQKVLTNLKNSVFSFKNLIGRKFNDPVVQAEKNWLPYELVQLPNNRIGIKVQHAGSIRTLLPEQVLAAQLEKLKEITEAYLKAKVTDCVIGVPSFWTDAQRRALLDACSIADIGCLKLLNETTAVALTYGIYKQEFPAESEPSQNVIFIDVGHSTTQISACAYNKGKLKMLGVVWDMDLGGRDFDMSLCNVFANEFATKYKINVRANPKASLRLMQECEKLKKQMAADPNKMPLAIDCFMDDKDVVSGMKRSDFEELCSKLFTKFSNLLKQILVEASKRVEDIHSVELVGGGSRLPKLKSIVKEILGKEPCTTLNQDEAVARGCTLQCAILSPTFRVREFGLTDVQPYSIKLNWDTDVEGDGESEVFAPGHPFPFSKVLTFYRSQPFALRAAYSSPNCIPYPDYVIGKFMVNGVVPTADGSPSKVKVKVRINPSGIFSVCSATLHEKVIVSEPMDTAEQPSAKSEKPVVKAKVTDLPIMEQVYCLDQKELDLFIRMDRTEREKADAKNAVEEYVYEIREKINDSLRSFITDMDHAAFLKLLNATEEWLYEEGENQQTETYRERLAQLKVVNYGDPVVERWREACERPKAFEDLARSLQQAQKAYEAYQAKNPMFDHWDQKDADRLLKAIEEKYQWYEKNMNMQSRHKPTDPPSVFVSQIVAAREVM